jgi:sugar phosphate isomerase/epimerase
MADSRIGVMQGRLSPRPENRLQAFPHQTWPEEFAQAKRLGFSYLEWIYEAERAAENPIASGAGRAAIRACAAESGLPVASVCADYFMIHRLTGGSKSQRSEHAAALSELVCWTRELGATRILLPLLPLLEAVHLKDRVVGGTSQPFGRGAANFDGFFGVLSRAGYAGDFLTQHYFDANPEASAAHSLGFVQAELRTRRAA